MPIYAFLCEDDHRIEIEQDFHDQRPAECPKCGKKLRRIWRAVPVIYKGQGFYSTDNNASKRNRPNHS